MLTRRVNSSARSGPSPMRRIVREDECSGIQARPTPRPAKLGPPKRPPRPEEIDRRTLEGCIHGDGRCFSAFVSFYRPRLYRYLGGCADLGEVEDVAMMSLMKAYQAFHTYVPSPGATPFTWLAAIAHNTLVDQKRIQARQAERAQASAQIAYGNGFHDPEPELRHRESLRTLQAALRRLPQLQREVFVLKELERRTFKQIATIVGVPEGTAKSRYKAALKALARWLRDQEDSHGK
jgi:RNA polymerase sigma factor (sigma-70 family)